MPSAESTPPAAGTQHPSGYPARRPRSQACSGPAPPNATSSRSRGSWPCSTLTTRIARTISWLATATIPGRGRAHVRGTRPATVATARPAAAGRAAVRRPAARPRPAGPAPGWRRSRSAAGAAAAVAGRARDRRPRCAGPTRSAPPSSIQAMLPPPAPTVWMSSIGSRTGSPATVRSVERPAPPPRISETSQLVPPMSKAIASRAPPEASTAATPPAGPDSSSRAGCAAASASEHRPPLDCISSGSGSPRSRHRRRPAGAGSAPSDGPR